LTEEQEAMLLWWRTFEGWAQVPPTVQECATGLGIKPGLAASRVRRLVRLGLLEWNPHLKPGASRAVRSTELGQQWSMSGGAS